MSSNIKEKNLIYSFSKYDELPYQSVETVNYGEKNKFVNMVQLNNTYGQCVDNDMYVAKTLVNRLNGYSQNGPKLVIDQNELDNLPDGAKFFSSAGSANIMQKHVRTLQQSLVRYSNADFNELNFIHSIGSQTALLCTSSKTCIISISSIGRDGTVSSLPEVKTESNERFIVTAVLQYGEKSKTLFAGRPSNSRKHGLYLLVVGGSNGSGYELKKLHEIDETNPICAMAGDDSSSRIAFATSTSLYVCHAYAEDVRDVSKIAVFGGAAGTGNICALIASRHGITAFTDSGKIYCVNYSSSSYTGLILAKSAQISLDSIVVHEVKTAANGVAYAATNFGLCLVKNSEVSQIDLNFSGNVQHIDVDGDGIVWCGDANGNVLKSSSPTSVELYAQIPSSNITDFKTIGGVRIAITQSDGMFYESSEGQFSSIAGSNRMQFTQIITGFSSDQTAAYIVGSNNGVLSAVSAKFSISSGQQPQIQVQKSWSSSAISPDIRHFVLNSENSDYVYLMNGTKLYLLHMTENGSIGENQTAIDFASIIENIANVQQVNAVFTNGTFGSNQYSYANLVLSSGRHLPIVFKQIFSSSAVSTQVMSLDTSSDLETKLSYSSLGCQQYSNGTYTLYGCYLGEGAYCVQYADVGLVNNVQKATLELAANDKVDGIAKLDGEDEYALQTQTGVYLCKVTNNAEALVKTFSGTNVGMLASYEDESQTIYCVNNGNSVLSSGDLHSWNQIVAIGSSSSSPKIDSFLLLNQYILLAGKTSGNDVGMYYTYYNYYVENNTQSFTAESAYYAYYDNEDNIDQINMSCLHEHVLKNHLTLNSDMDLINSCMDTKFQLSGFMKVNSETNVSNDYIDCILTGTSYDDNILVHVCNSVSNYRWNQLTCTYLAKCWKSGFTELYMYLPTTTTYYIPHIEGASQCNGYDEEVIVKGRNLMSNIKDNVTSVRINIVSAFFTVDTLAENTIKANSLPLRIFKDDTYEDACAGAMYHSFVCPSVARDFSPLDTLLGYYSFHYYCFGSDAQAVKLSFLNKNPNYGRKYKTITYHANGGQLTRLPGMKKITQRIYEGDDPVNMYWDIFDKEGSFFIGWSKSAGASNEDESYTESTLVSYDSMKLRKLTLHACWLTYKFGANDTSITINNALPSEYTIAEITIDPNASIPNNPKLGNKLIVSFGD